MGCTDKDIVAYTHGIVTHLASTNSGGGTESRACGDDCIAAKKNI